MVRNAIQFQRGLGEVAFHENYGSEVQCETVLEITPWPDGFVCLECGTNKGHRLDSRNPYQCTSCRRHASLTAGTVFEYTKLPLGIWFRSMYHLTQSNNVVLAMELIRRLGVSYNTAWLLKQKLMEVILEREPRTTLTDRVESDDAYTGGDPSGGKVGRGAPGNTLSSLPCEPPGKTCHCPKRYTGKPASSSSISKPSQIRSSSLQPTFIPMDWPALQGQPALIGGERLVQVGQWVNTGLGNMKSPLIGTYRNVSRHISRYLAEFQYRFNRRYDLAGILSQLSYVSLRTPPMPYKLLNLAKASAQ